MSQMTTTSSPPDVRASLELFEVTRGKRFSLATLRALLPTVEDVLFFGKVYSLNASELAALLWKVCNTDLAAALFGEGHMHSTALQGYLIGEYDDEGNWTEGICASLSTDGEVVFDPEVPHGEILPQVWEQLEVEVATSIKAVADKLEKVVSMLPGKQGSMMFQTMRTMNARRPVIGDYKATISHQRQAENLLVLDDSGSMTEGTIRRIIADVVALSYNANAHFVLISNSARYWAPGTYDVDTVLKTCEYGGTHYEHLHEVLNSRNWGTVITVADYDSSRSAREFLASTVTTTIDSVVDVSLVNRPTYLAECVGQFASEVKPILIGNSGYVLA